MSADFTRPKDGADLWETPEGLVRLHAPAGSKPYYRLEWKDTATGKRRETSGGKAFRDAWRKAVEKEKAILAGETSAHEQRVNVGIDYWLDPNRRTPRTGGKGWGDSHRSHMEAYARTYFRPMLGDVKLSKLTARHFQTVVNAAPTENEAKNVRRAARSLIGALQQGSLLPEGRPIDLKHVHWEGSEPEGCDPLEGAGEDTEDSGDFVPRSSRPSNAQVRALREAAEELTARGVDGGSLWWRGLMVETAAYAGPRWSELIALTAHDLHREDRKIRLHHRVSQPAGKVRTLTAPKMGKRRTTVYPAVTPTGYRLEEALRRRATEALDEQAKGTNKRALLFPSKNGTWQHTGNFHRDIFQKAATAAGWPSREVVRPYGKGTRKETRWKLTWHSLRHTFCTFALEEWQLPETIVAEIAGHADISFTKRVYVGTSEDALEQALTAAEPWAEAL